MLPLAIYLTEEYRLLDRRTLERAVERYYVKKDEDLLEQIRDITIPETASSFVANAKTLHLDPLPEPISRKEADHNFNRYLKLVESLQPGQVLLVSPELLHPRYTSTHFDLVAKDLIKRLVPLAHSAQEHQCSLVFDFCNETRLHIQLDLLSQLIEATGRTLRLGLTLTAASKRCVTALGLLEKMGRDLGAQILVRLAPSKGLEEEIVFAQRTAMEAYPVLRHPEQIADHYRLACRFLRSENAEFLNVILVNPDFAISDASLNPDWQIEQLEAPTQIDLGLDQLPDPVDLFAHSRKRAPGVLVGHPEVDELIAQAVKQLRTGLMVAKPVIDGIASGDADRVDECHSPIDFREVIGKRFIPSEAQVRTALGTVASAHEEWDARPLAERQKLLTQMADLISEEVITLAACLSCETGKPVRYALEEVRDAIDLAYYYIGVADDRLKPVALHSDQFAAHIMEIHGRGVFLIAPSPEQPIAETLGNLTAALITGNGVVVKPPEAASLTCAKLFDLVLKALIPPGLIAFLPGGLREIGDWLLEDYRIDGVVYTGLGVQGSRISQKLASRPGAQLIPIMVNAEGQSIAMIDADQSIHKLINPLLEQAVYTAGQYPLSSHVVYLEQSIADEFEQALVDALPLINMDDPILPSTDLGPSATKFRLDALHHQVERMRANGRIILEQQITEEQVHGLFMPPTILRLYTLDELQEVVPGPLLYLIRFDRNDIGRIIKEINRTGYGLALSLFSDDEILQNLIRTQVRVGNLNFNHPQPRGSAGALPVGGVGPSGTGPQIGGPNYLVHFTCERTRVRLLR